MKTITRSNNWTDMVLWVLLGLFLVFMTDGAQAGGAQAGAGAIAGSSAGAGAVIDQRNYASHEVADFGDRVPDTIAPSYPSTYNCALGVGLAGSISGFGIGGGGHYESDPCNIREDAVMAARLGEKAVAIELMCQSFRYYKANRALRHNNTIGVCTANEEYDDELAKERRQVAVAKDPDRQAFSTMEGWQVD